MKILASNDDGFQAIGLRFLVEAMREIEQISEVIVVAPDRNRSGASNSLTLDRPLRTMTADNGFISVNGTPTDCVHIALTGMLKDSQDICMVVSGINDGANCSDDVLYSGTVAAATEGRKLGLPAIAFSLGGERNERTHYATAARVAKELVLKILEYPLPPEIILNVNIPDLPYEQIKGWKVTRLGTRHMGEPTIPFQDPRGKEVFWVGLAGPKQDAGPGTDFHAVDEGYVSITPLQFDLTDYKTMAQIEAWFEK